MIIGAPERIRTSNHWIRNPVLYPVEPRAHTLVLYYSYIFLKRAVEKQFLVFELLQGKIVIKLISVLKMGSVEPIRY
jgi:hypothetical protein